MYIFHWYNDEDEEFKTTDSSVEAKDIAYKFRKKGQSFTCFKIRMSFYGGEFDIEEFEDATFSV